MKNKLITMIAAITMLFACNAEYTPEQIVKLYGWKLNSALDENAITEGNVDAVRLLAQSNRNYGVLIECAAIKGETKDLIDTVTFMYNTTTNWSANSIAFMRYVHNYDIKEVTSVLFGNSPNKYICT